jgi:hypothetical protein
LMAFVGDVDSGLAEIVATVFAPDGHAVADRLTALARTVCEADPRTLAQRRADAFGALAAGADRLSCRCGSADCPAGGRAASAVLIHVIAEQSTVEGTGDAPGVMAGYEGLIPAELIAELAKSARLRPLIHPRDAAPECGYTPSRALADFVRFRDLTCRFPGCDEAATACDVDHTIPHGDCGPTHASNLKCLCRFQRASRTLNQPCYERIVEVLLSDGETHGAYFERSNGGGTPVRRGLQRGRRRGHGRNMRRPDADPRRDVAACVAGTNS